MNNTAPLSALRHHVTGAIERGEKQAIIAIEAPKSRWDDPSLWVGTGVRHCKGCHKLRVTRNGLCWLCEHPVTPEAR